jgi:hypothetical protein
MQFEARAFAEPASTFHLKHSIDNLKGFYEFFSGFKADSQKYFSPLSPAKAFLSIRLEI